MSLMLVAKAVQLIATSARDAKPDVDSLTGSLGDLADAEDALSGASPALRKLLGASDAQGDPYSASFGKDGQQLGGAFSNRYAFDLLEAMAARDRQLGGMSLAEIISKGGDPAKLEIERRKSIEYFNRIFGQKFGDVETLIKELIAYQKRAEQKDAASRGYGSSSQKTSTPSSTTSSASLKIMFITGKLP